MNEHMEVAGNYWDNRYNNEGKIWGEKPSITAYHAQEIFQKAKVKSILVPGSGYGRHTRFFSNSGFEVTGIEISPVAINIARQFDTMSHFYNASVIDMSFEHKKYDAIYCFNVLHLFRENERKTFLKRCEEKINDDGLMFFTVFSASPFRQWTIANKLYPSKPGDLS